MLRHVTDMARSQANIGMKFAFLKYAGMHTNNRNEHAACASLLVLSIAVVAWCGCVFQHTRSTHIVIVQI